MTELCVWAPRARKVEIVNNDRQITMEAEPAGWFCLDASWITHGVDYAFLLDGEGPFPDPRSAWQPAGVHQPSRYVDHTRFSWSDSGWQAAPLSSAVVYELHVGTFTPEGTFEAVIDRLDHLLELGVTHVELMPVNEFPGERGWGYDGVDLFAPHHVYGGPEGLKQLIDACHGRGLAVLLDVVYNHLGPSGNYLSQFGPYFTQRYSTPWGDAVNLDGPDSDPVRRFFIDNALMWLRDYHMDGLRIDAVHAILDRSAIHFLEQLASEVSELEAGLGRHLVLIAESDLNDPRIIRPQAVGGYGIDAQWNEDFHHALHAMLTGERRGYYCDFGTLADIAKVVSEGQVLDGCYSRYRRRHHGRPATGLSAHKFLGCLQNHDQVGNRAVGDRACHLLETGRLKVGVALVLTSPFVPLLFQGEEWAASSPFQYFTDHQEPELAEAVRRGRRQEFTAFGWDPNDVPDPQSRETFERSVLDWTEVSRNHHAEVLQWYRSLVRLRTRFPDLTSGRLEAVRVNFDEQAEWLVMIRGRVLVACNLADTAGHVPCPGTELRRIELASEANVRLDHGEILLPGNSVAVLVSER